MFSWYWEAGWHLKLHSFHFYTKSDRKLAFNPFIVLHCIGMLDMMQGCLGMVHLSTSDWIACSFFWDLSNVRSIAKCMVSHLWVLAICLIVPLTLICKSWSHQGNQQEDTELLTAMTSEVQGPKKARRLVRAHLGLGILIFLVGFGHFIIGFLIPPSCRCMKCF